MCRSVLCLMLESNSDESHLITSLMFTYIIFMIFGEVGFLSAFIYNNIPY